ncbi:protein RRP6-like 3 isoform X2 [Durio zibethinus]|uniref:Protein RRP6-like 3 isoform X2 n=1 Tax=Durio zibethinus TaxID=66656 RepID=A0A6P5XGT9_DURZI|nr:protein RRP6-like 3 isoform X2 [Durio zibethinus]
MENKKEKMKILLTIASVAAISIFFTAQLYRRRRKQRRPQSCCYLHSESKPQLSFKRVFADNSCSPFNHFNRQADSVNEKSSSLTHPYESEITTLMENPQLLFSKIAMDDFDAKMDDSYVWVETESQLSQLAQVLSEHRAFAVDTEQHSLRSFLGFTALIQISTEKEDYLVDAIALHDAIGILRPVFADPNICKVFHGADGDIVWLQRDFHIYVVNLFDTAKACEVLSKPQKSLAYLLETYCGVATNKLLQREDWRQRPLSEEMVQYARTDAHYLLYIANCLMAELKQQDCEYSSCPDDKFHFVLEASRRSNMICLQLYAKEVEDFPGASAAFSILSRQLNGQGSGPISGATKFQDLVRRLCAWRDLMARVHDESTRYILSDYAIVALSKKVPTTQADIYSTIIQADLNIDSSNFSSSLPSPSPLVCSHWIDVHQLIQDKLGNLDKFFPVVLQNCLGPNGSCPLSVFNYALLMNCSLKHETRLVSKQNGFKNPKQVAKKASRELFIQKFSCKSPVYHNCRIYANDGRLLCYCDHKKLEWYLHRDLAKLVDDEPPAIMLLFEPKGRPEDEDNDFYIQSKKNICVGCGEGNHYLRYRVIPSCYRIHFPEHLKSHRSHDIVLLCVDCHEVAHAAAEKYKKQIAGEFGIPLYVRKVIDLNQASIISGSSDSMNFEDSGVSPLQLRTAAKALLRHGPEMPPSRLEELTQIVMRYYGGREISKEDLERALVAGMSPHERRRLEKKKGLSLKQPMRILPVIEQESNNVTKIISTTSDPSKVDNPDVSDFTADVSQSTKVDTLKEALGTKDEMDFSMVTDADDTNNPITSSNFEVATTSTTAYDDMNSHSSEICENKSMCAVDANDNSERSTPNELVDSSCTRYDGNIPLKHNSKLSLLGHGPHGKQVVDRILNEYGEEGIRQFCQRWRQVFVEAVHPRFLPAGWDVMHRI